MVLVQGVVLLGWERWLGLHGGWWHCGEVLLHWGVLLPEGVGDAVEGLKRRLGGCFLVRLPLGMGSWRQLRLGMQLLLCDLVLELQGVLLLLLSLPLLGRALLS